ncbi:hypothetical protein AJ80_04896 [Polytolypa hystricis UAMH7299]|uniref:Conserved oligomeric Golgi complex subunit 1 n=1 Tax=Polytolypa hystricis (strain UAMH7299) TaxID=1447883 RepID=A0A2B7XZM2_POLH7|nr:hypothetical protein AJ80_04896 [Polytolypa hystricis UAMH7299]
MATDVPDAQTLKSWEEAFQYPIPTVRRVEQELRRDIASNREKLRSLVGVKYRDLLDTAQTIVEMNGKIQVVESKLADVGRRCNPRLIEKESAQLQNTVLGQAADNSSTAAQIALLHNCSSAISRMLRKHGSSLLIAKLLVISRLLHNTLSQDNRAPTFLENLRSQLASLRRTLLNRIDRRLASPRHSTTEIVESMSALCLATSSSFRDVIKHFHDVRLKTIGFLLQKNDPTQQNACQALKLYLKTLQDTMGLLSGNLSSSLRKLTSMPILSDPDVQNIEGLGIDIFRRWVTNDVKNFTPWLKDSDLSKPDAIKLTKTWSKTAFAELIGGISENIAHLDDFKDMLSLRKRLLDIWLPVQSSTPTHSSTDVLKGIRNVVNDQLKTILRTQIKGLTQLGLDISSIITSWDESQEQKSPSLLWQMDLAFLDFSEGGEEFKGELMNRLLGKDNHVSNVLKSYQIWLASVTERRTMIEELGRIKWDDVIEEVEYEEILQSTIDVLHEDDPALLRKEHQDALTKGFNALQTSLHSALANMVEEHRARQAAFLIRVIREIRRNSPGELSGNNYLFCQDLVPKLHGILASDVVSQIPATTLTRALERRRTKCPGRTLWEGDPPQPIQPSPAAFKFIRKLVIAMEHQGTDLWSVDAVVALKTKLMETLVSSLYSVLEKGTLQSTTRKDDESETSGAAEGDSKESPSDEADEGAMEDHHLQLLFDVLYLEQALSVRPATASRSDGIRPVIELLKKKLAAGGSVAASMEVKAQKYWGQTQLLFGLLG